MFEHSDWTLFTLQGPLWCRIHDDGRIETEHGSGTWRRVHTTIITVTLGSYSFQLGHDAKGDYVNHGTGIFLCQSPPREWRMMRGPSEVGIWGDIVLRNEYRLPERFEATDIVVDIGAHVGTFAKACLDRGAGLVVCFEPDGQNFEDLAANLKAYSDRCVLIRAAAWTNGGTRKLSRPIGAEHTGGGSIVTAGENETIVQAIDATAAIVAVIHLSPIRFLKLDCEGAEWELLRDDQLYRNAQSIAMEWHENAPNADLAGLRERLAAKYSTVEVVENVKGLGWLFAS